MPRMRTKASHDFDQVRRNPGDEYEAEENMADIVQKLDWAERLPSPEEIVKVIEEKQIEKAPEDKALIVEGAADGVESNPTRTRRTYRRRDMQAEG